MDFRALRAAGALCALLAFAALLVAAPQRSARAATIEQLVATLNTNQPQQDRLSQRIAADTERIGALQPDIDRLGRQLDRLQGDIDIAQAQLTKTQDDLRAARERLLVLQAKLAHDRAVLARQLVQLYEEGPQDWTTVVMSSHGFKDLLERTDFLKRVAKRNAHIFERVRLDRAAVKRAEVRLQALEAVQLRAVQTLLLARNRLAAARDELASRQSRFRGDRRRLRARLARMNGIAADALQAAGLQTFNGFPVAAWIHPILVYAADHGWNGHLVQYDGFRTYSDQIAVQGLADVAAAPGQSRHEGTQWPDGAIDIPDDAANFNSIVNRPSSPYRGQLLWRAAEGDPVHFSSPAPVPGKGY
jgi:peptidoglycan hydrolase CwlO-like protein